MKVLVFAVHGLVNYNQSVQTLAPRTVSGRCDASIAGVNIPRGV